MNPTTNDTGISLLTLNSATFLTTRRGDEVQEELRKALGHGPKNVIARMAIARSLSLAEAPPAPPVDEAGDPGKTIIGHVLFGEDLAVWLSLIVEHAGGNEPSGMKEIREIVARHWRRGLGLLAAELAECRKDPDWFDRFILQLAGRAGLREGQGHLPTSGTSRKGAFVPVAAPIPLRIGDPGRDLQSRETPTWLLNGRGNSPHVAVMGTLGTGKTRTAVHMIRQVRDTARCPVILFDMAKGDLAADRDLIAALDAEVVRAPATPVPLDVLHTEHRGEADIVNAAIRFRESFGRVKESGAGGMQLDALRDAAQRALSSPNRPVKISDVKDRLREVYAEKKRRDDGVVATFNDLTAIPLFDPKHKPADFFQRSWIIDVHEATETAQRMIVFLVLDALYTYLSLLPDSEMDAAGHRALRVVLGVDEARKVLGYRQPSLVGLIRESRSKGGAVFLISQSPDDFDAEDDNFLENIGLGVCFRTNARSRALSALLGQTFDLAGLANGVCVTRLVDKPGVTRIQAWE